MTTAWFKLLRSWPKLASNWFKLAPSCPKLSPFSFGFISSWPQVAGKGWIWGYFGIILEVRWSLWINLKLLFGIWRLFWYTWGSFGGHSGVALGQFGVTVASLWRGFGTLWGSLWAYGGAIGSPGVTLGLPWRHFGSSVGLLLGYEGGFGGLGRCFGVTLSSL